MRPFSTIKKTFAKLALILFISFASFTGVSADSPHNYNPSPYVQSYMSQGWTIVTTTLIDKIWYITLEDPNGVIMDLEEDFD